MSQKFLNIPIRATNRASILEKIQKHIRTSYTFCHIVSLNPENMVVAQQDEEFRHILSEGDIQIVDGVGMSLGGSILGIPVGERVTGADLMEMILQNTHKEGLRILLLGGRPDLAEKLAECYQKQYPRHSFQGIEGIADISQPKREEEEHIFSIVADYKPQILFVAFGSPQQERWIYRHRAQLKGIICMGVGGGFDFAAGDIRRAPRWVRNGGLEWLFRLFMQPWRWKRQMRLVTFVYLILLQRVGFFR